MNDVIQIRVGKHTIGIRGLKVAIEHAVEQRQGLTDEQIGKLLLEELSQRNYILPDLREVYDRVFLREYKKQIGEPISEPSREILEIKVLGPGCSRCERLTEEVMAVLSETGITADLEHVRDVAEIGQYGVIGSPALVINGEVKVTGAIPSRSKLKAWIELANQAAKS